MLILSNSRPVSNATALAYAATVGLATNSSQIRRLGRFLDTIARAGVTPVFTTLGRSEFLARSGATHRSVIGPNATITGTLGNTTEGIEFDAGSGDHLEFDNPSAFTSGQIWQLVFVAFDAVATDVDIISGANGNTGPVVRIDDTTKQINWRTTEGPGGTVLLQRGNPYNNYTAGTWMVYGGQQDAGSASPIVGIYRETNVAAEKAVWNNETKWRIGESLSGFNRLDGKVSLAMAGLGKLTLEQNYKIVAAAVRNSIASFAPPCWLGFVGDSMTLSVAGGALVGTTRQEVWTNSTSGWKGSIWDMRAVGGEGIDSQEGYFAEMMIRMSWAPDMPRCIVFWGGYNHASGTYENQSQWEALADRYIAMAVTAAAAGISTVHWSTIIPVSVGMFPGTAPYDGYQAFNDYYKAGIEALDGNHIFYDHRTNHQASFDGTTRNNTYFGDSSTIHVSGAGIAVLMADFLTQYPNPP